MTPGMGSNASDEANSREYSARAICGVVKLNDKSAMTPAINRRLDLLTNFCSDIFKQIPLKPCGLG
jgi:hypothetical protein